ncbi:MAG: hypothetical protein ACE5GA_10210, partial [Candidatus Zixiibacteriota bacterium]
AASSADVGVDRGRIRVLTLDEIHGKIQERPPSSVALVFIDSQPPDSFLAGDAGSVECVEITSRIKDLALMAAEKFRRGNIPQWRELEPIYAQRSNAEINFECQHRKKPE